MIVFPVPEHNDSLVEVELENATFFLHFSWNSTGEFWTMAIENAYNNELVSGIVLLTNRLLLKPFSSPELPAGDFVVVCDDEQQAVTKSDFSSKKACLIYLEAESDLSF